MQTKERIYVAIDLKSFFASVECVERGLNPLTAHLVVADESRTEKTICLAVSPALKAYGIAGRARLFEVVQRVRQVNLAHPEKKLTYTVAPPHMAKYLEYSRRIRDIYLKYIAPEDLHVYSIDEVIMDVTAYLGTYRMTAHELTVKMIRDVLQTTGITATAGIGTNMYLCKVAMDIVAKHIPADADGVRIAELNEQSYRRLLWTHRPITDFWRVGRGTARKLERYGLYTMGDVARQSVEDEELLYQLFGINAELLIDHAWGWEPCTMEAVKAYRPAVSSLSSGQVLHEPYNRDKARIVVREMAEAAALNLLDKHLVTNQLTLYVGYDRESLAHPDIMATYKGALATDHYGRLVPKPATGTLRLSFPTSSASIIAHAVMGIFDHIVHPALLIRRLNLTTGNVHYEDEVRKPLPEQLDLFTDYDTLRRQQASTKRALTKERKLQETMLSIKKRFGKNALLTGLNFADGATAKQRNQQIGGHKA